jgi:hypothetical protein
MKRPACLISPRRQTGLVLPPNRIRMQVAYRRP